VLHAGRAERRVGAPARVESPQPFDGALALRLVRKRRSKVPFSNLTREQRDRPCRSGPRSFVVVVEGSTTQGDTTMRVMVIVKANKDSEAGVLPSEKVLAEMGKFNEELVKAGVMLAGEGLQASSKGARIRFSKGAKTVIDGPFAETKELVAGFWLWQVKSMQEAIDWLKRAPFEDTEVEIRQVFETEDFAPSDPSGKLMKKEEELRKQIEAHRI
jgi:hypothetical protein